MNAPVFKMNGKHGPSILRYEFSGELPRKSGIRMGPLIRLWPGISDFHGFTQILQTVGALLSIQLKPYWEAHDESHSRDVADSRLVCGRVFESQRRCRPQSHRTEIRCQWWLG